MLGHHADNVNPIIQPSIEEEINLTGKAKCYYLQDAKGDNIGGRAMKVPLDAG